MDVYRGKRISVSVEAVALPDGSTVQKEIIHHRGAVVMIPFLDRERVVLVRNYRVAVGETLLELPAGTIDPGEGPDATARRELEEETGYKARQWHKFREFFPSPGILTEVMHLYVAEGLEPGRQKLDPGEQLEPITMPWTELVQHCLDGMVKDGKTLVGVLLWDRLRNDKVTR